MELRVVLIIIGAAATTVHSQCATVDSASCATWNSNGFCTNAGYALSVRQAYCPISCPNLGCAAAATTAAATVGTASCATADNAACAGWASNGFCTNTGYTVQQRQSYCPFTCTNLGCPTLAPTTAAPTTPAATTAAATTPAPGASCATADHPSCTAGWVANGFCTNTGYSLAIREAYCPVSCPNLGCPASITTPAPTTVAVTTAAATTPAPGASCASADHPNCAGWVSNGFCTNTGYTLAVRESYCPVSCPNLGCPASITTPAPTTAAATTPAPGASCGTADVANCVNWVANGFCTNTGYTLAQREANCPVSCPNLGCPAAAAATTAAPNTSACAAADHPSCASWASNNFCTNTGYTLAVRQAYCPKTCSNLGCP